MIKKRVISTLLWDGFQLVKGVKFKNRRKVGSMMQAVRVSDRREVDELVILDIAATLEGRGPLFGSMKEFCAHAFMPTAIGGGVRSCWDIEELLRSGADKVVIGSAIFDRDLIKNASRRFGAQAIVVAIDVSDGRVVTECGFKINDMDPEDLAVSLTEDGAGEVLLTSIDHEGKMEGFDCDLIERVARRVKTPVIAAGGGGTPQDVLKAFEAGADAVAIGSMFLFTEETPISVRRYLHDNGIDVRL